ncbi:hypothetical protein HK101_006543 [Irineochytrium annulatum]|nr:hypothetical protein HK101_006543 [Irineochytrium annulatum]
MNIASSLPSFRSYRELDISAFPVVRVNTNGTLHSGGTICGEDVTVNNLAGVSLSNNNKLANASASVFGNTISSAVYANYDRICIAHLISGEDLSFGFNMNVSGAFTLTHSTSFMSGDTAIGYAGHIPLSGSKSIEVGAAVFYSDSSVITAITAMPDEKLTLLDILNLVDLDTSMIPNDVDNILSGVALDVVTLETAASISPPSFKLCDLIYDSTFWFIVNANATVGNSGHWTASFYYNHIGQNQSTYSLTLSADVVDIKSAFESLTSSSLIEILPAEFLTYNDVSILVEMSKSPSFSLDAVRVKAGFSHNITIIPGSLYLDALYVDVGLRHANGAWGIAATFEAQLDGAAFTNSIVSVVASFTHLPASSSLKMSVTFPSEPLTLAEIISTISSSLSLGVLPSGLGTDILNAVGLDYLHISYSDAKPDNKTTKGTSGFERFDIGLTVAGSSTTIGGVPIGFTNLKVNVGCDFLVPNQTHVDFSFTGGAHIGSTSFEVKIVRPAGNTTKPTATLTAKGLSIGAFLKLIVGGFDPNHTKATDPSGGSQLLPVDIELDSVTLIWAPSGASITNVRVHFASSAALPGPLASLPLSSLLAKTYIDYNVANKTLHLNFEIDVTVGGVDFDMIGDVSGTSGSLIGTEVTPTDVLTLGGIADSLYGGATSSVKSHTGLNLAAIGMSNAELDFHYAGTSLAMGFSGQVAGLGGVIKHPVNVEAVVGRDGASYFALGLTTSFATVGDIIGSVSGDDNFPGVDFLEAFDSSTLGVIIAAGNVSTKPGFGFAVHGPKNTAHNFPVVEGLNLIASVQQPNCQNISKSSVSGVACLVASCAFAESGLTSGIDLMVNIGAKGINTYASAPVNASAAFGLAAIATGAKQSASNYDVKLKGFAMSQDGNLKYPGKIPQPWTGMGTNGYGAVNPPMVGVDGTGNVLLNLYLQYNKIPDCPGCDLSTNVDIFVGVHSSGVSTGLVNIADVSFGYLGEPIVKLASAYGLFRLDETNRTSGSDNVCNPSGLYFHVESGAEIYMLDKIRKYISIPSSEPTKSFDAFFLFRPEDSLNALGMRYQQQASFLGMQTGLTEIDFQYIGKNEVNRRKNYKAAGCPCTADGSSYCKELSVLDRYVIEHSFSGDSWIILHASVDFNWYIVKIEDAELLLIADVKNADTFASTFKITLDAHVTVLFILKEACKITVDSSKASFTASVDVELVSLTIAAEAGVVDSGPGVPMISGNNTNVETTSLMKSLEWDLEISYDLNPYILAGIKFVSHLAVKAAEESLKALDTIKDYLATTLNKLHLDVGGVLNKLKLDGLVSEIPKRLAINPGVLQIKNFESMVGLPSGINNLIPGLNSFLGKMEVPGPLNMIGNLFAAAQKFKNGDDIGGVGDLLASVPVIGSLSGLLFHSNLITYRSSQVDDYGNASLDQSPALAELHRQGANYTAPLPTFGNVTVKKAANESTSVLTSVVPTTPLNVVTLATDAAASNSSSNGTLVNLNQRDSNSSIPDASNSSIPISNSSDPGPKPPVPGAYLPATPLNFTFPSVDLTANASTINATLSASLPGFYSALKAHFLPGGNITNNQDAQQLANRLGQPINPPIIRPPSPMWYTCKGSLPDLTAAIRNPSNGHLPVIEFIDPECNGSASYFPSSPLIDAGHPEDCGAMLLYNWTLVDSCGQRSNTVQLPIMVDELAPVFANATGALDITISCDSSTNPNVTGTPVAQGGCGMASLNYTFVDNRKPTPNVCGGFTIVRTWTVKQQFCSRIATYVQHINIIDKVPPVFATFPANASTDLFKPVGSDTYGYPTAFDTCGNGPVSISSADSYDYSQTCAADKKLTRTWTATDGCGNRRSQNQTISIVNSDHRVLDASVGGIYIFEDAVVTKSEIKGQIVAGGHVDIEFSVIGNGTCSVTPYDVNANMGVSIHRSSTRGKTTGHAPAPYVQNVDATFEAAGKFAQLIAQDFGTTLLRGPRTIMCVNGNTTDGAPLMAASDRGLVNSVGNCTVAEVGTVNARGNVTIGNSEVYFNGIHPLYNFFDVTARDDEELEWKRRYGVTFNVPAGSLVFINNNASFGIDDLGLTHVNLNGLSPSSILWNFPHLRELDSAENIFTNNLNFHNAALPGSILAPHAFVSGSNAIFSGQVIGRSVRLHESVVDCNRFYGFRMCSDPIF